MSRMTPPSAPTPSGAPDPNRKPVNPAHRVNVPISPIGHKPAVPAKPGAAGPAQPLKPAGGNGATTAGNKPPPAGGAAPVQQQVSGGQMGASMPPIDQLQGRPIGRVLTKMGKVTREQVVEALTFQKSKGGALGRILIDLGYIKETDLNIALAAQKGYKLVSREGLNISTETIKSVHAQLATTNT